MISAVQCDAGFRRQKAHDGFLAEERYPSCVTEMCRWAVWGVSSSPASPADFPGEFNCLCAGSPAVRQREDKCVTYSPAGTME